MNLSIEPIAAPTTEAMALLEELDSLLGAMYEPEQRHSLSVEQLFAPNIRFFVARLHGQPAGCGGIAFSDGYAEVKRMYSRPPLRGRGIAKALLARLEQEARQAGHAVLRLETGIRQPEAIGLYERCGFRRCAPFGPYAAMNSAQIGTSLFYEKRLPEGLAL